MGQRVNGVYIPTVSPSYERKRNIAFYSSNNLLLMSRKEFYAWLEENNKKAKPIRQLIEEYESSKYEDNRPFGTK